MKPLLQFLATHALTITLVAFSMFGALILFLTRRRDDCDDEAGVKLDGEE